MFLNAVSWLKTIVFWLKFHWQWSSIGAGNGLTWKSWKPLYETRIAQDIGHSMVSPNHNKFMSYRKLMLWYFIISARKHSQSSDHHQHIEAEAIWPPFLQMTCSYAFSWMKTLLKTKISLKYVPEGPMDNKRSLVQIMGCRRTGDKPLFEPMMVYFTNAYWRHSASMS